MVSGLRDPARARSARRCSARPTSPAADVVGSWEPYQALAKPFVVTRAARDPQAAGRRDARPPGRTCCRQPAVPRPPGSQTPPRLAPLIPGVSRFDATPLVRGRAPAHWRGTIEGVDVALRARHDADCGATAPHSSARWRRASAIWTACGLPGPRRSQSRSSDTPTATAIPRRTSRSAARAPNVCCRRSNLGTMRHVAIASRRRRQRRSASSRRVGGGQATEPARHGARLVAGSTEPPAERRTDDSEEDLHAGLVRRREDEPRRRDS